MASALLPIFATNSLPFGHFPLLLSNEKLVLPRKN
jgi:hypothetical protein